MCRPPRRFDDSFAKRPLDKKLDAAGLVQKMHQAKHPVANHTDDHDGLSATRPYSRIEVFHAAPQTTMLLLSELCRGPYQSRLIQFVHLLITRRKQFMGPVHFR